MSCSLKVSAWTLLNISCTLYKGFSWHADSELQKLLCACNVGTLVHIHIFSCWYRMPVFWGCFSSKDGAKSIRCNRGKKSLFRYPCCSSLWFPSFLCPHLVFKTAVVFVYKDSSKHRKKIVSSIYFLFCVDESSQRNTLLLDLLSGFGAQGFLLSGSLFKLLFLFVLGTLRIQRN